MAEDFKRFYNLHIDSTHRYQSNLESIIEKYSKVADEPADTVSLKTLQITENKGHIRNFVPIEFGRSKLLYKGRRDHYRSFHSGSGFINKSPNSETFDKTTETDSGVCEKHSDGAYSIFDQEKSIVALHETFMQVIKSDSEEDEQDDVESLSSSSSTDLDYDYEDITGGEDETSEAEEEFVSESALQSETINSVSTASTGGNKSPVKAPPCESHERFAVEKVKKWLGKLPIDTYSFPVSYSDTHQSSSTTQKYHGQNCKKLDLNSLKRRNCEYIKQEKDFRNEENSPAFNSKQITNKSKKDKISENSNVISSFNSVIPLRSLDINFNSKCAKNALDVSEDCKSKFSPNSRYRNRSKLGETFVIETSPRNSHQSLEAHSRNTSFESCTSEELVYPCGNKEQSKESSSQKDLITIRSPVTKYISFSKGGTSEKKQTRTFLSVPAKPIICVKNLKPRRITDKNDEHRCLKVPCKCCQQSNHKNGDRVSSLSDNLEEEMWHTVKHKPSFNNYLNNASDSLQTPVCGDFPQLNSHNEEEDDSVNNTDSFTITPSFINTKCQNLVKKNNLESSDALLAFSPIHNVKTNIMNMGFKINYSQGCSEKARPTKCKSPEKLKLVSSKHEEILRLKRKVECMDVDELQITDVKSPSSSFKKLSLGSPAHIHSPSKKQRRDTGCVYQAEKHRSRASYELFTSDKIIAKSCIKKYNVENNVIQRKMDKDVEKVRNNIGKSSYRMGEKDPVPHDNNFAGVNEVKTEKRNKVDVIKTPVDTVNQHVPHSCRKSDFCHSPKQSLVKQEKHSGTQKHRRNVISDEANHINEYRQNNSDPRSSFSDLCETETEVREQSNALLHMDTTWFNHSSKSPVVSIENNELNEDHKQILFKAPHYVPRVKSLKSEDCKNIHKNRQPSFCSQNPFTLSSNTQNDLKLSDRSLQNNMYNSGMVSKQKYLNFNSISKQQSDNFDERCNAVLNQKENKFKTPRRKNGTKSHHKLNFDTTLPSNCHTSVTTQTKTSTPEKKNHVFMPNETLSTICTEVTLCESDSSDEDAIILI